LATAAIALLMGTGVSHADIRTFQEKGSWAYSAELKCAMGTITDYIIAIEYKPIGGLSIRAANRAWKMAENTMVYPVFVQFGSNPWIEVVSFSENLEENGRQFSALGMQVIDVPVSRMTEGRVIRIKFPKETMTVKLVKEISDAFQKCTNAIDTLKE
jgi:hypothetical protein